ncbi:hypothetical protein ACE38W_13285 [Chitinophaga sp. Hz27]|uniref:hypothetical protein n=1 Tax=Chitinophaga sp. Hz27 TaxID=3347169 RepID=UPI0035DA56C1
MKNGSRLCLRITVWVICIIFFNQHKSYAQSTLKLQKQQQIALTFMSYLEQKDFEHTLPLISSKHRTSAEFKKAWLKAAEELSAVTPITVPSIRIITKPGDQAVIYYCISTNKARNEDLYKVEITFANDTDTVISKLFFSNRAGIVAEQMFSKPAVLKPATGARVPLPPPVPPPARSKEK